MKKTGPPSSGNSRKKTRSSSGATLGRSKSAPKPHLLASRMGVSVDPVSGQVVDSHASTTSSGSSRTRASRTRSSLAAATLADHGKESAAEGDGSEHYAWTGPPHGRQTKTKTTPASASMSTTRASPRKTPIRRSHSDVQQFWGVEDGSSQQQHPHHHQQQQHQSRRQHQQRPRRSSTNPRGGDSMSASLSLHTSTTSFSSHQRRHYARTATTSKHHHRMSLHDEVLSSNTATATTSSGMPTTNTSRPPPRTPSSNRKSLHEVLSASASTFSNRRGADGGGGISGGASVTSLPVAATTSQQQQQQQQRASNTLLTRTGTFEHDGFLERSHRGGHRNSATTPAAEAATTSYYWPPQHVIRQQGDMSFASGDYSDPEPSESEISAAFYDHAVPIGQQQPLPYARQQQSPYRASMYGQPYPYGDSYDDVSEDSHGEYRRELGQADEEPYYDEDDQHHQQQQQERPDWLAGDYNDPSCYADEYYDDELSMPDDYYNYPDAMLDEDDDWQIRQGDLVDLHLSHRGGYNGGGGDATTNHNINSTASSSGWFFRQRDKFAVDQTVNLMDANNPHDDASPAQTWKQRILHPFRSSATHNNDNILASSQRQHQQHDRHHWFGSNLSLSNTSSRRGQAATANRWDNANPYGVDPNKPIGAARKWYLCLLLLGIIVGVVFAVVYLAALGPSQSTTSSAPSTDDKSPHLPSRADLVQAILTQAQVSTDALLLESPPSGAAARAFQWLVEYDPAAPKSDIEQDNGWVVERFALAAFYFAAHPTLAPDQVPTANSNSTQGSAWKRQDKWMTDAPVCDWFGVECAQDKQQTAQHQQQFVTQLNLTNNNLNITLLPELKGLEHLQLLDLSSNNLRGRLETSLLNSLTELEFLILNNNALTGPLLDDVHGLSALQMMHLDTNQLSSAIPTTIGALTKLRSLKLQRNQLNDTIPSEIGGLAILETLHLSENDFHGPLPEIFDGMGTLTDLELHRNPIRSSLPESISKLSNLRRLTLHMAGMSGTLPDSWSALTTVDILLLHHNSIIGPIPEGFGQLTDLNELWLDHNFLYDSIPSSLGNLTNLRELMLEQNALEGSLPSELGGLQNLERLRVFENQMSGSSVPSEICSLRQLHHLKNLEVDCAQKVRCACCTKCQ